MPKWNLADRATHYVLERACPSGGFCFYRMDEPNPLDTYFALATLSLLGVRHHDEKTTAYLQSMQNSGGSYESLARAFFSILSLKLLGEQPSLDPKNWINVLTTKMLSAFSRPGVSPDLLFHRLDLLVALRKAVGLILDEHLRNQLWELLRPYLHSEGGFGMEAPYLEETQLAVGILRAMGRPPIPGEVETLLRACEHPEFGFTGKPGSSLFFLEYVHAGLALCALLGVPPTYGSACVDFVRRCQMSTGGFARASTGIATLENTYFAIHSLEILGEV